MKSLFETLKTEKPRSTVFARSNTRGFILSAASLPCVVEEDVQGKTLLVLVEKGKVKGVFNRMGQQYPKKAVTHEESKEVLPCFVPAVTKGFTPEVDGIYVAHLTADGVARTKIKSIISLTRAKGASKPEQTLIDEKFTLVFTDHFTVDEFEAPKCETPFIERRTRMESALAGVISSDTPHLRLCEYRLAYELDELMEQLSGFGGAFLKTTPLPAREAVAPKAEEEAPKKEKKDKKAKKDKKGKKDKSLPICEKPNKNESPTRLPTKKEKKTMEAKAKKAKEANEASEPKADSGKKAKKGKKKK